MRRSAGFVIRRLAWALIVVFGVTTLSFVIARLLPGDPARMLVGPQASPADVAHAREVYRLDEPLASQYVQFWTRLIHRGDEGNESAHASCARLPAGVHVDLGFSFQYQKPVVDLLAAKAPRSIELAFSAMLVQLVFGVGLGVLAAARRGSAWDEATMAVSLVGVSAPTFLLGLFLQYVFAYKLRILPYDGYGTTSVEHAASLVLPSLTLGVFGTALYARLSREELGSVLEQDFIRTARAKGAGRARVLFVHGLRNAIVPIATLAALDLGTLIGGAIVTEKLFRWPGVGEMTVAALLNRDGPVLSATVLFASTAVVLATLVLDLVHFALDPRERRDS